MTPSLSEVLVNRGKWPPAYIAIPTGDDTFKPKVGLGGIRCGQGVVKGVSFSRQLHR